MNRSLSPFWRLRLGSVARWLPALVLTVWLSPAAAQSEALRVLLGPQADLVGTAAAAAGPQGGAPSAPSASAASGQRQQVTVRRGESLTGVIRRTLPDAPYKDDLLRQAFVQLNPAALPAGPHRVAAGAVLQVPNRLDLRLMAEGGQAGASVTPAQASSRSADEDRRTWVRFP